MEWYLDPLDPNQKKKKKKKKVGHPLKRMLCIDVAEQTGLSFSLSETPMTAPSKRLKSGHYQPVSETPCEWRFAAGPIVARDLMLAGRLSLVIEFIKLAFYHFSLTRLMNSTKMGTHVRSSI